MRIGSYVGVTALIFGAFMSQHPNAAQPKYLEAAFEEIDRIYGSFDIFLDRALGVSESDRRRLVDLLTEPITSP